MKVLQIGKFFPPYLSGGIENTSYQLHKILNENGIDTSFLGFLPLKYNKNIFKNKVFLCKTNFYKASTPLSYSFFKVYKKIKDEYDIIYINLPNPMANLAITISPPKNAKIIVCWHSDIIKQKKLLRFYKPLLVNLLKKTVYITAPSLIHLNESDFSKYFKNKVKLLPLLQNYPLKVDGYSHFDFYKNKKIILAVGRLVYYKGFDTLIKAAKFTSSDCEVHIVGIGEMKKQLQNEIDDLDLHNKVKLLGKLSSEDLEKEYKNAFLFAFPSNSRAEMLGLVQYEAFSYAKPIISCNIPRSGTITINKDNETGFIVPVNDEKQFAEKINILIYDKNLYERFSKNAVEILNRFNSQDKVNDYKIVFESALTK